MRIFIVDTLYGGFIQHVYSKFPDLVQRSLAEQNDVIDRQFFPSSHYWAEPLRKLGHEILDAGVNNPFTQVRWCAEAQRSEVLRASADEYAFGGFRVRLPAPKSWPMAIAEEQIRTFRPDVILCGNLDMFGSAFLETVRPWYGIAVGQHASPLPQHCLRKYDLIFSSLPNQVAHFRSQGIRSEYLKLAFDHRIISHLTPGPKKHGLGFLGQVSPYHLGRAALLRALALSVELDYWGNPGWEGPEAGRMRINRYPAAWGLEMYQTLRDCRIVFNAHLDAAEGYANNLRLYEVTGAGSLLLTDWRANLNDLFEIGREVVAYRDIEECVKLARHFLANDDDREAIAAAGQARILREHTFERRAVELNQLIEGIRAG